MSDTVSDARTEIVTRYGRLLVEGDEGDLIVRFLRVYGEWAGYEVEFVAGAIEPGARVADIGAFLGTFGLGLMAAKKLASVCFVEANPAVAPLLRRNVERNATAPATVLEAVIVPAGQLGAVAASVEAGNAGSFSIDSDTHGLRHAAPLAETQLTLPELCARHGPFDLLKLDVEGLEAPLLRDALALLAEGGTRVWAECSERATSLALCQVLLDAGLDVHYFAAPVFCADNFNHSDQRIFPWAYEAGLFGTKGPAPALTPGLVSAGCILRRVQATEELRGALWDTPRWAPADWSDLPAPALVARACHALLGERYEDFLLDGKVRRDQAAWAEPLPKRLEREVEALEGELDRARSLAAAGARMLHAEREWIGTRLPAFEAKEAADAQAMQALRLEMEAREQAHGAALAQRDAEIARLATLTATGDYRIALALRGLVRRFPRLYRLARPMLRLMWRAGRNLFGRGG